MMAQNYKTIVNIKVEDVQDRFTKDVYIEIPQIKIPETLYCDLFNTTDLSSDHIVSITFPDIDTKPGYNKFFIKAVFDNGNDCVINSHHFCLINSFYASINKATYSFSSTTVFKSILAKEKPSRIKELFVFVKKDKVGNIYY